MPQYISIENVIDDSSSNNHATPYGRYEWVDDPTHGTVLEFDGETGFVDVPDLGNPGTGSIALWFKKGSSTSSDYLLDGRETGNWWFLTHYNGSDVNFFNKVTWDGLVADQWYHVAVTVDGTETKLYIDGSLVSTGTSHTLDFRSTRVGVRYSDTGHFPGCMTEITLWNRVISQSEVQDCMNKTLTGSESGLLAYYKQSGGLIWKQVNAPYARLNTASHERFSGPKVIPNHSGTIRGSDVYFKCTVTVPDPIADGTIYEMGGTGTGAFVGIVDSSGTPKLRVAAGDGGTTSSNTIAAILDYTGITSYAGQQIDLEWDFQINPGRVRLWINGSLIGTETTTDSSALESSLWAGTDNGGYGVHDGGPSAGVNVDWQGTVDSVLELYSGALKDTVSLTTVWKEADAFVNVFTEAQDLTGNGNTGTLGGDAFYTGQSTLEFRGGTGYVQVPITAALQPNQLTVEFWSVRYQGGDDFACEVVVDGAYYLRKEESDGSIDFRIWTDGSGDSSNFDGGPFNFGEWDHIAGTFDGSTQKIYKNGVLTAEQPFSGNIVASGNPLFFSGRGSTADSHTMYGSVRDIRIWDHARTQTEIQDNMNTTLTGSETGLVGYWNQGQTPIWKQYHTREHDPLFSHAVSNNTGSTVNVPVPSGAEDGDPIAVVAVYEDPSSVSVPSGWTTMYNDVGWSGGPSAWVHVLRRTYNGESNFTFNVQSGVSIGLAVFPSSNLTYDSYTQLSWGTGGESLTIASSGSYHEAFICGVDFGNTTGTINVSNGEFQFVDGTNLQDRGVGIAFNTKDYSTNPTIETSPGGGFGARIRYI